MSQQPRSKEDALSYSATIDPVDSLWNIKTPNRAKRGLAIATLERERDFGMDITPTVAGLVFERLIGRGMDDRAAAAHFATPGRTTANKLTLTAEDFGELKKR